MIKKLQTQRSQNRDKTVDHYAALHQSFTWQLPEHFNLAANGTCLADSQAHARLRYLHVSR